MNTWHLLTNITRYDSNEIFAQAGAGKDCLWFSGHFPGDPILPGIAQLALVMDSLHQAFKTKIRISGLKRVRFRQIIRPGDPLKINIKKNKGNAQSYSFKIMTKDEIACAGTIIIEKPDY
ncbi:Beta-hydroxydecanoyl thiol ester dehydrase domain-containing protein, FabA/FabZ [Desulfonema limicola]|uniref:Beta-hydroxydecanoyl thiol ester dehydrase domain-containing protein, FabA/FabZ n=1 Tax=Desulfonema limicola TaxID=45656 RepID=A0A975B7C3_9BACT|nr:hypothetical protein [Desulfonema limicola]QTA80042.1 Beta-hydroxydecanoyl thiol ester dehydrase domain-containing protein, FabA/FabZ [Desulfonema limicola]